MLKRIIEHFKTQRANAKIKRIIKLAYSIIFSEKYDFSNDSGVEYFKKEIEENCKNRIETLQAYSLINLVLYNEIPIEDVEKYQNNFRELLNDIQREDRSEELLEAEFELETLKLKTNLLIMDLHVKTGKSECDKNEFSYRGLIYRLEKAKKAFASLEEKDDFKRRADELNEIQEQIKMKQEQDKTK